MLNAVYAPDKAHPVETADEGGARCWIPRDNNTNETKSPLPTEGRKIPQRPKGQDFNA